MMLTVLNVPQLKLVCFTTTQLIHRVLMSTDVYINTPKPFRRTCHHFVGQLIGSEIIKIPREQAVQHLDVL